MQGERSSSREPPPWPSWRSGGRRRRSPGRPAARARPARAAVRGPEASSRCRTVPGAGGHAIGVRQASQQVHVAHSRCRGVHRAPFIRVSLVPHPTGGHLLGQQVGRCIPTRVATPSRVVNPASTAPVTYHIGGQCLHNGPMTRPFDILLTSEEPVASVLRILQLQGGLGTTLLARSPPRILSRLRRTVIAQPLLAASANPRTPESLHSLHAYFLRWGS